MWTPSFFYFMPIVPNQKIDQQSTLLTGSSPSVPIEIKKQEEPIVNQQEFEQKQKQEDAYFWTFALKLLKLKYKKRQKKAWSKEQDQLIWKCGNNDQGWTELSNQLGIPVKNCLRRYERLKSEEKKWPSELNEFIKATVQSLGENWTEITEQVHTRFSFAKKYTKKTIRQRYKNYLRPGLEKRPWNIDEDLKLLKNVKLLQENWGQISAQMTGRSEMEVKNRYYGILKALQRKALRNYKLNQKKRSEHYQMTQ